MSFKSATCPSCGGNLQLPDDKDQLKCMYCGGNVIVREAIRLASGVNIANYLELARSAAAANNKQEAYEYFSKVLESDPTNVDAWFGKGEAAGWLSTINNIKTAEMLVAFNNAIKHAKDEEKLNIKMKAANTLNHVLVTIYGMARKHLEQFVKLDATWLQYLEQCNLIIIGLEGAYNYDPSNKTTIENIIFISQDNIKGITYSGFDGTPKTVHLSDQYEAKVKATVSKYQHLMKKLDPSYTKTEVDRPKPSACYVVTATMGDENHSSVVLLRDFRDTYLIKNRLGKQFILIYEIIGPLMAKMIQECSCLKRLSYFAIVCPASIFVQLFVNYKTKRTAQT